MQTLRDLPHIATMAFNTPLLLEPAYARVFFCALASQMGMASMQDSNGELLSLASLSSQPEMLLRDDAPRGTAKPYRVEQRIAVIPVVGTLVNKASYLNTLSGMTGYNALASVVQKAVSDPEIDGILLDLDTPGGMVAGAFDCADTLARMRSIKPIWALANDMNCSAGQLIASAASRRLVTQTASTGSIGVLMAHRNYARRMEKQGVEVTLIHSGARKTDGNEMEALPEDVRARLQAKIDTTRRHFAEKVSAYTGLRIESILATEAAVFTGAEALEVGLADEVVLNIDAVSVMREALTSAQKTTVTGVSMSTTEQQNTPTLPAASAEHPQPLADTTGIVAEAVQAAVVAENQRIMGILGCEEGKGREALASELAATPGMTVADARRILAASPLSAQARTETALDTLMGNSPAALDGGQGGADHGASGSLMNIPV